MKTEDLEIRWTRGKGPGGTNRNKTENCCNLTHIPTGIQVRADCRDRTQSLREAKKRLAKVLDDRKRRAKNAKKYGMRKAKIAPGGC